MGTTLSLNGKWKYFVDKEGGGEDLRLFDASQKGRFKRSIRIPSNWHIAGIKDYSGDVWFMKEFTSPSASVEEQVLLDLRGVDYFAKVWLNGALLGTHEGYFQPFSFDISSRLAEHGTNVLVVKVTAPEEKPGKKGWPHRKRIIKGTFGHHDVRPGAWSHATGQSSGTGGIWNDVSLSVVPSTRIEKVKISPSLRKNGKEAVLSTELSMYNGLSNTVSRRVRVRIFRHAGGKKGGRPVLDKVFTLRLKKGRSAVTKSFTLKSPSLWWPWDHGKQDMYIASCECSGATVDTRFGIRDIRIAADKGWVINGRKIFVRGTNIIPEEYLSAYTPERIRKDIEILKGANCNAVRVHAHVNRKELYDAFDEAGLLVWQDFALQWEYTDDRAFIKEAERQIRDMVSLLHNNPSIVVWCCHNEPVVTGKKIDPVLEKAVLQEDGTRHVMRSSDFASHPYPGWFWGHYRYYISLVGKPFPSEFGAQALPRLSVMKRMFAKKDLWPPNWKEWAFRDFAYEQTFQIAGIKMGRNIGEFINNSQQYQAKVLKFAIENFRRNKGTEISGLFQFMMLEPWPCISYSVVDYFRNKKAGYFAMKNALQPVLASASLQRKRCTVGMKLESQFWVINDFPTDFPDSELSLSIVRNNNVLSKLGKIKLNIAKDSCKEVTDIVYSISSGLVLSKHLKPGPAAIRMEIRTKDGTLISENSEEIILEKVPTGIEEFRPEFLWEQ